MTGFVSRDRAEAINCDGYAYSTAIAFPAKVALKWEGAMVQRAVLGGMVAALVLCGGAVEAAREQGGLSGVSTIVAIDGECVSYTVSGTEYGCSGLMYLHWRNNRTGYMLPTINGGSLMVSGGSDSQLTPEHYVLNIDRIAIAIGRGAPVQTYRASGKCESNISTDGNFVHDVKCNVTNGAESMSLTFKGANKRVTIKHFP